MTSAIRHRLPLVLASVNQGTMINQHRLGAEWKSPRQYDFYPGVIDSGFCPSGTCDRRNPTCDQQPLFGIWIECLTGAALVKRGGVAAVQDAMSMVPHGRASRPEVVLGLLPARVV